MRGQVADIHLELFLELRIDILQLTAQRYVANVQILVATLTKSLDGLRGQICQ
ncbi:hypothetical protein D3C86_1830980 [compost metagenome]